MMREMKRKSLTGTILFNLGMAALLSLSSLAIDRIVITTQAQRETAAQAKPESDFELKRRDESSKNPANISFTIRLAGGRGVFSQGEVIRIETSFSSSLPKKYEMSLQAWDRSGRLRLDEFHIDPEEGFSDPM